MQHSIDHDRLHDPDDFFLWPFGLTEESAKAAWSAARINDLPDGAFLYIEPGGKKDGEGKTTPRSLRHFPYKNEDGKIDLPHLRNAIQRIPQSNVPASVKKRAQARARRILVSMRGG